MILLQAPSTDVKTAVERIVAAHARLTSFEARIERPAAPPTTIARSGNVVWLRVPDTSGLFPSTRTICAKPDRGWSYDGFLAELVRAQVKGRTPFERLVSVTGSGDDAVRLLLEPAIVGTYLRSLAKRPGAKLANGTITFPEGTRVTFDPATRRIVRLTTKAGGTQTGGTVRRGNDVRYRYGGFGLLGFAPVGVRGVVQPTALSTATRFESATARRAMERFLRKNARLTRAVVNVEGDAGAFRIAARDGQIRQTGHRLDLGYDGRTLVVVDLRARRTYRGAAKRSDVRRIAAGLQEPLHPLATAFLGRSLPFAGVLFPPRRVALGGTIQKDGVPLDILRLEARGTRATLFVRPDGLVTSLESQERDQSGVIVAQGRQSFRYEDAVGSPGLPTTSGTVLPLPKR